MLKDRLTNALFALLALALVGGAMLLSAGAPMVSAAPALVLTASAEPPTATPPPTSTAAPSATPVPGLPSTPTPGGPAPSATPEPGTPEPGAPGPDEPGESDRFADPAVSKEANRSEASLGDEISFSITVTNEGNDTAQGVIVEDPLPGWLALVSASVDKGRAVTNGNTAGFWIGDVAPGEVVRGEVTARVVAIPEGGEGFNEVVLTAINRTDRLVNNRAAVRLRVTAPTPTPTAEPAPSQPTPTPTPAPAGGQRPPPAGLPVTAGRTSLPVPAWAVFLVAVGYMAVGVYFWRRPRK